MAGRNRGTMDCMAPLDDAVRDLYSDLEIDGRVLDLGESSASHFDLPPDELVEGDPARFERRVVRRGAAAANRIDGRATFAEAARVLRPGRLLRRARSRARRDDAGRVRIVRGYFAADADAFGPAESDLRASLTGTGDRLWAVWAKRR